MAEYDEKDEPITKDTPPGTKVLCVKGNGWVHEGQIYTISGISLGYVYLLEAPSGFFPWRFVYV